MGKKKFIIIFLVLANCGLFQSSVRISPVPFDYKSIAKNYFDKPQSKPFPLTVQRGNNLYNSVTADGRYLFFASDQNGNFDIYFRDLQSSIVVPVTQHPSSQSKPSISPDGRYLVFETKEFDPEGDLVMLELSPKDWVEELLKGNRYPDQNFKTIGKPNGDLALPDRIMDTDPVWSPDGTELVFVSERETPGEGNLYSWKLFSKEGPKRFTSGGAYQPCFSPDGKSIVYLSYQDNSFGEIYLFEKSTRISSRITNNKYIELSPSLGTNNYLYFSVISKDSNLNGKIDDRDQSILVKQDLVSGEMRSLTTESTSVFDVKYSNFNGGSILFSASYDNAINVYFLPSEGYIPKFPTIKSQFEFISQLDPKKHADLIFLAHESLKGFYTDDPLYPLYYLRSRAKFYEQTNSPETKSLLLTELSQHNSNYGKALSLSIQGKPLNSLFSSSKGGESFPQEMPALAHLIAENILDINKKIELLEPIWAMTDYTDRDKVGILLAKLQISQLSIPDPIVAILRDYEMEKENFARGSSNEVSPTRLISVREALAVLESRYKGIDNREKRTKLLSMGGIPDTASKFLMVLEAESLSQERDFNASNAILDSLIPIPTGIDLEPPGQPSVFEKREFQAAYTNPAILRANLSKYQNERSKGNTSEALRNLKIYLEFYNPALGVDLKNEEMQSAFFYFENKALDFEKQNNLLQSSFHYFFNNQTMFLVKTKNLYLDSLYKEYAIYYQRKMVDTIFGYGKKLREEEEKALYNRLNVLSKDKLNVVGNLSELTSVVTDNRYIRGIVDIKDLERIEVLSDSALQWTELYYKQAVPRARPYLDLATLYGYSYYLINKYVIYETTYYQTNTLTKKRKEEILANLKKAEWELRWIVFADPTYNDAYQLLGWLYQYIDLVKLRQTGSSGETDEDIFEDLYQKYFPSRNLEENVGLYKQILVFLGEDKTDPKILSDLYLNLGNNYFLLSDFPKAEESYGKVAKASQSLISKDQFENHTREALYHYHYGRTLHYEGNFRFAILEFDKAIQIYLNEEYNKLVTNSSTLSLKEPRELLKETKNKLAMLYALRGLSELESNRDAVVSFQSALSFNQNYLSEINLNNYLAIAFQRQGRFSESQAQLDFAEKKYKESRSPIWKRWSQWTIWDKIFPDKLRVIGEGRFPGELPDDFKYLLTLSIRVENYLKQREFGKAKAAIDERNEFLKEKDLENTVAGGKVLFRSKWQRARVFFEEKDFLKTMELLTPLLDQISEDKTQSIEDLALEVSLLAPTSQDHKVFCQNLFKAWEKQEKDSNKLGVLYYRYGNEYSNSWLERSQYFAQALSSFDETLHNSKLSRREQVRAAWNASKLLIEIDRKDEALQYFRIGKEKSYEFQLQFEDVLFDFLNAELEENAKEKERVTRLALNRLKQSTAIFPKLNKQIFHYTFGLGRSVLWNSKEVQPLVEELESYHRILHFQNFIKSSLEFSDTKRNLAYQDLRESYEKMIRKREVLEKNSMERIKSKDSGTRTDQERYAFLEKSKIFFRDFPQYSNFNFEPSNGNFPDNWLGYWKDGEAVHFVTKGDKNSYKFFKTEGKDFPPLANESLVIQPLEIDLDWNYLQELNSHFQSSGKIVTFIGDRFHTQIFAEKSERRWRVLTREGEGIPEGDIWAPPYPLQWSGSPFSDSSSGNLPNRTLLTNSNSEISVLVLKRETSDWNQIMAEYGVLQTKRIQLLAFQPNTLDIKSFEDLKKSASSIFIGIWDYQRYDKLIKNTIQLEEEANDLEKSGEFQRAYSKYISLLSWLGESDTKRFSIELKKINSKINFDKAWQEDYPKLLMNFPKQKNWILYNWIRSCILTKVSLCKASIKDMDKEGTADFELALSFYEKMISGKIQDWQRSNQKRIEIEAAEDQFLVFSRISDLLIQNLLLDEAWKESESMQKYAESQREKTATKNRMLEIYFHRTFLFGASDARTTEITNTSAYSLGFRKSWDAYNSKINSREFTKFGYSDTIYDQFRIQLYQSWRLWEENGIARPPIPGSLSNGKSVLSRLSELNRSLYFFLLSKSLEYEKENEIQALGEALAKQEEEDNALTRAYAIRTLMARKLNLKGKKKQAEAILKSIPEDLPPYLLEIKQVTLARLKEFPEKLLENKSFSEWDIEEQEFAFIGILNRALKENQSSDFFDISFAREEFRFQSKSKTSPYSKRLMEALPKDQEYHAIFDLENRAYLITVNKEKVSGRELPFESSGFRKELLEYRESILGSGLFPLQRESLADRFRNQLRLAKGKRHYLYLSGIYSSLPLSFPKENEVYLAGPPQSFLDKKPLAISNFRKSVISKNINQTSVYWNLIQNEAIPKDSPFFMDTRPLGSNGFCFALGDKCLQEAQIPKYPIVFFANATQTYFSFLELNRLIFNGTKEIQGGIVLPTQEFHPQSHIAFTKRFFRIEKEPLSLKLEESKKYAKERSPEDRYWAHYKLILGNFLVEE